MSAKLIVALDCGTFDQAKKLIDTLCPKVKIFKVGSPLFTACGPKIVESINKKKAEVFLDLKFHDIPNTVAHAVRSATRLNVKMLTLHISGGADMLKAAVQSVAEEAGRFKMQRPLLIGVTVLTSQEASPEDVFRLANMGLNCGIDGVVCSVRETAFLRANIKKDFVIVTPGIRSNKAAADDQKRTATAQEASSAGSDFLVVGRPIVEALDPLKAVRDFMEE